jgi:glucose-6-phosphate isomerase
MVYKQNTEYCFGKGLLDKADITTLLGEAKAAFEQLTKQKASGNLPILSLADESADLAELQQIAANISGNFDNLMVLGTGGSSLCPAALSNFCSSQFGNNKTRIIYFQNIDPWTVDEMFAQIDISKTYFLAISKSGTSIETLTQLSVCLTRVKSLDIPAHFMAIAMQGDNILRRICARHGIKVLDHDPKVGGRFSILSNVGLLPALVSGMDVKLLRKGAAEFFNNKAELALESAAIHVALMRKGIWQNVLMTYPDRLEHLNTWYRQIWAESIGKNGTGSTPIKALGTIDQHSQMQLYLGGRKDKFYNFITLDFAGFGEKLEAPDAELSYLNGKSLGDVINAEQKATIATLAAASRPVRAIEIAKMDAEHLGMLIMHLMLETIITSILLGVNPYDQPAVEEGKVRARKLLGSDE